MELMFEVLPLKLDLLKSKPQYLEINSIIDRFFVKFYTIWSICQGKQSLVCDLDLIHIVFKNTIISIFLFNYLCDKPQILTITIFAWEIG